MKRVAIVVVRYGATVTGGAELHARMVATRLVERGHEVTVLTTCAEDYVSWANALPAGRAVDGGVQVLRFLVSAERDLSRWEAAMQPFLRRCWTPSDEESLLRAQGPDCPALLDHLRNHGRTYDAVIFFTLLYAPTVFGLPLVWDRAILVPTLHDEISASLDAQARAIRLARHIMWNSPEERDLAERIYDVQHLRGDVAGVGVEPPDGAGAARAPDPRARFGLDRPYLLYVGRVDPEKGCGELFEHFLGWARGDTRTDLVLAGRAWMEIPADPRIHHLGFVDASTLWALMSTAIATVVPSRNESLSLVALESLGAGTPIVVTADSPVLIGHAQRSGGGLVYRDGASFARAATLLIEDSHRRAAMGKRGRDYVVKNYTWERVMGLYEAAIEAITGATTPR